MIQLRALISACLFLSALVISGQTIEDNLQFLKDNIGSVQGKKTEYQQTFSYDVNNNLLLSLVIVNTQKGEERTRQVNALDLNPYQIQFDPHKEWVKITAGVYGGKRLVMVKEDGEVKHYDKQLEFYAPGIEQARKLTDALKSVAQYAKDHIPDAVPVDNNMAVLLDALRTGITNVMVGGETYAQSFNFDAQNNHIATFVLDGANGDKIERYTVNLSDINPHKIDFDTKRNKVVLPLTTKGGRKLIAYSENGETGSYTHELQLLTATVEQARLLAAQTKALVHLAESRATEDYTTYNYEKCVQVLNHEVGDVVINQDAYEQVFAIQANNGSVFTYSVVDVSEGEKKEFTVNAADLGKIPATYDTNKNSVFVKLAVAGDRDLVLEKTDGTKSDYKSSLKIRAPDIETARRLAGVFTRFTALALEKMNAEIAFASVVEARTYVLENIGEVVVDTDTYRQTMAQKSEDDCLYSLNVEDISDDKRFEYQFNLKDVDANKIQFLTQKGEALLTLAIKGGKDLVQVFENGEADKFTHEVFIKTLDLEQARRLMTGLRMMADACNP
ncbi:hypothetical protein SAMN06265379_102415 [Saccharicrinis carchari]|uniref:Uncharacterized protein n=1 Tax=Saccharicrinis carchari TaxID=1168039 RepID=A0A521C878_SACCC|nr:hypothetical protein [Saccharicrinis carchari]SMO55011.1 hypothetical protein SAMN06265379_102415 [Saccharicrinis carchari]